MKTKTLLTALIILAILPNIAFAWGTDTQIWLSNEAVDYCIAENLSCMWLDGYRDVIQNSSCPSDSYYSLCQLTNCPALERAEYFYKNGYLKINQMPETAEDLMLSAYYFTESYEIWNQIEHEDYIAGRTSYDYDIEIDDHIRENDTNWTVTKTHGIGNFTINEKQTDEDMQRIARNLAHFWGTGQVPTIEEVQDEDLIYIPINETSDWSFNLFGNYEPQGVFQRFINSVKSFFTKLFG